MYRGTQHVGLMFDQMFIALIWLKVMEASQCYPFGGISKGIGTLDASKS